jgi:hypothetical protein
MCCITGQKKNSFYDIFNWKISVIFQIVLTMSSAGIEDRLLVPKFQKDSSWTTVYEDQKHALLKLVRYII